jgi:hypothetical protein
MSLPKWLQVLAQVGPQVLMFTPLAPIAGVVVAAIGEAQAMQGASGQAKLAHVVNIATDAAQAANLQAGRVVIDPAVLQATAATAISTAVSVTKMVHDAHEQTVATVEIPPETPAAVQPTPHGTV